MRSPARYDSRGTCSRTGRIASAPPRSTMMLPRSKRRTMPEMSSPLRSLYWLKTLSRSASRTRCRMTCLAVCAAMRPKPFQASVQLEQLAVLGVLLLGASAWSFSSIEDLEQQLVADLGLEAEALGVGHAGSPCPRSAWPVTCSTMTMIWNRSTRADLLVELRLHLALHAEGRLAAVRMACSSVSTSTVRSMFLSLETWSSTRPRAAPSFM